MAQALRSNHSTVTLDQKQSKANNGFLKLTNQVTPASEWVKPIIIKDDKYGDISLRPFISDISLSYLGNDLSSRDFTALAIVHLSYKPKLEVEEVMAWDDGFLEKIARIWAAQKDEVAWDLSGDDVFSDFRAEYGKYSHEMAVKIVETLRPSLAAIGDMIQKQAVIMQSAIRTAQENLARAVETSLVPFRESFGKKLYLFTHLHKGQGLLENLPNLAKLAKQFNDIRNTAIALQDDGYEFMLRYWTPSNISAFVGIDEVDKRVRSAAITNRMLGITRSDDFSEVLEELIQGSLILHRRWRIIEPALKAHRDRNYALAIPTLLTQVEGMFTDALVTRGIVIKYQGKICAHDGMGNPKLNRKGDPIPLNGLGQKVKNSDLQNEYILQGLAEFFTSSLVAERNGIMHGHDVRYDHAKLSAKLMWSIFLLAEEFLYFERED